MVELCKSIMDYWKLISTKKSLTNNPQSVVGRAILSLTLGYLRGLEIPSLRLEDMPRLKGTYRYF